VVKTKAFDRSCCFEKIPIMILMRLHQHWIQRVKFVQVALENMMNRTSIVIAHRLQLFKSRYYYSDAKGKIVEQGSHDELIALNGMYNKLVTLQSFE
jgi:ABC-type transport system involved in Fe-S cluster assembly fused permease/ATPase subunit